MQPKTQFVTSTCKLTTPHPDHGCGSVDGWLLGPPVIGGLVGVPLMLQQGPSLRQGFDDGSITFLLHLQTTATRESTGNVAVLAVVPCMLQQSSSLCHKLVDGSATFTLHLQTTGVNITRSNIMLHNKLCRKARKTHMPSLVMDWQQLCAFLAASNGLVFTTANRQVQWDCCLT